MTHAQRRGPPGWRRWAMSLGGRLRVASGTLVGRFAALAFLTLAVIGILLGWLLTMSLTDSMLSRATRVTADVVSHAVPKEFTAEDFLAPNPADRYEHLAEVMGHLSLGPDVALTKVWDSSSTVVWAYDRELVGRRFEDNEELNRALSGEISSEISLLTKDEQVFEREFTRLLELYVPIRFAGEGDIAVVFEVYENIDSLDADITRINVMMWGSIAVGFVILFAVLYGIVRGASRQIERQAAEIGRSEERYRNLVLSAQDGIITADREGRMLLFNRMAETIFGYESSETIGQPMQMLMPPEYRAKHSSSLARFFDTGRGRVVGTTVDLEGLRKNGERFAFELSLSASGEGEDKFVTGILRDITERRDAERLLGESEERWRAISENSPAQVMLLNENMEILFINHTVPDLTREQVIGQSITSFVPPDFQKTAADCCKAVWQSGKPGEYSTEYVTQDGETKHFDVWIGPVFESGQVSALVSNSMDVTDRKATEDALRANEERYRAIFDQARDGIVLIDDGEGWVVDCNQEFERQTGRSLAELRELHIWELRPPEQQEAAKRKYLEVTETGSAESSELAYLRPDGQETPVEFVAKRVRIGGRWYHQSITRDITERRRMEEQLRRSEVLASLGETIAGIAHEVSNPLSAIILYSELVEWSDLPSKMRGDLRVIRSEAKRAAKIMRELLAYSRKVEPLTRWLDVNRTIRKVLKMRCYQEQVRNIGITTNLANGALRVRGDAAQLTQVFMNLILNAEAALSEASNKSLIVTSEISNEWARISVADNGTGIPKEHLDQVFLPFFSTKPVGKGTGLGLSTCYGIVTAHKGRMRAENNDIGGATFIVELPLAGKAK